MVINANHNRESSTLSTSESLVRGNSHQPLLMRYPLLQWLSVRFRPTLSPTYSTRIRIRHTVSPDLAYPPSHLPFPTLNSRPRLKTSGSPFLFFPCRSLYHPVLNKSLGDRENRDGKY